MKAIVVDDEPIMLKSFIRVSKDIPEIELVGQFRTAKTALEYVMDNPVEIAFLDVYMPIMNGIELAKELRAHDPQIKLVFISAFDDCFSELSRFENCSSIAKPYAKDTLAQALTKLS